MEKIIVQNTEITVLSQNDKGLRKQMPLVCLSNMENINAVLINDGLPQGERLVKLNRIAIQQMQVLEGNHGRNLLK